MKITITTLFNGKKFSRIEGATLVAVIESMKETMESDIAPFADEIASQGGEVILNITGDRLEKLGGSLEIKNVSPDLKERILSAINGETC